MRTKWMREERSKIQAAGISLGGGGLLAVSISWIFYDSIAGMWSVVLSVPAVWILINIHEQRKQKQIVQKQFLDLVSFLAVVLRAGYSVEQGFKEAGKELGFLYPKDSAVMKTLLEIERQMNLNSSLEAVFRQSQLCRESRDARRFAEILEYAKRCGGNMIEILERTALQARDNISIQQEIETMVAGKKLEQKIMLLIPFLLLIFMKVTSPEFLAPLYHNLYGILFMSCALSGYLAAVLIGIRIMEIHI